MLGTVSPYTLPGQAVRIDILETAKALIDRAVRDLEEGPERTTLVAETYLLAGHYDAVLALQSTNMSPSIRRAVAWAFTMQAKISHDQAKTKSGAEADALFDQAGQKYDAALKIKPDFHDALYNWGIALSDQAKTKSGAEADALFDQARQKYEAALKIKPDFHEAL